jgi:uncharacterized membrane protein
MEILGILILLAILVFYVIGVPWTALSSRKEAIMARQAIGGLTDQIGRLQLQIDQLRARLSEAAAAQPADQTVPARKAAATRAKREAKVRSVPDPAPGTSESVAVAKVSPAASPETAPEAASADQDAGSPRSPWEPTAKPAVAPPVGSMVSEAVESGHASFQQAQAPPKRDFEEMLGTRWAVWVGGAALALGALFLVRYTIEAGFFGPRVRLAMAALFSIAFLGAGEALRRGVFRIGKDLGPLPVGHVPLALTAAGTVGLFGTVYAAYALYGFIGQTTAFVLMGGLGVAAMAAALLHGEALAGIGLIASYATPILVGGESRSRWPLVVFLLVITAASMALQQRLRTLWLGWATVAAAGLWAGLLIFAGRGQALAELAYITGLLALFAAALVWLAADEADAKAEPPMGDTLPLVALFGPAAAMGALFLTQNAPGFAYVAAVLAALALLAATALRSGRASLGFLAAGLLPLGASLCWPAVTGQRDWFGRVLDGALLNLTTAPVNGGWLTVLAFAAAALLFLAPLAVLSGRFTARPPHRTEGWLAIAFTAGLAAPVLILAWAIRRNGIEQDFAVAAIMLGIALASALVSDRLYRRSDQAADSAALAGSAGYASGAALALGLAIAFALRDLWMAVGFAAAALAIAAVNDRRPMPALRRTAAAMATTAVLRGLLSPAVFGPEAWPLLNGYLAAYGAPAAMTATAAALLFRSGKDRSLRIMESAALALAAVWLLLTIRHGFHAQNVIIRDIAELLLPPVRFHEVWVLALGGLAFVAAGCWLGEKDSGKPAIAAVLGGFIVMLLAVPLYGLLHNPMLSVNGFVAGYPVFNRLTVGYGVIALAFLAAAYLLRRQQFGAMTPAALGIAALFVLAWLLTQIRMAFQGGDLWSGGALGLGEAGVYVLVFLGIAILADRLRQTAMASRLPPEPLAIGVMGANGLGLALLAVLCLVSANPWLGRQMSGFPVIDSSFVGYLLPALALGWLANAGRLRPPSFHPALTQVNRAAAIGLGWFFLITQVRRAFAGLESFTWVASSDAEQYAYSLATLAYGVAILAVGFKLGSRATRLASAVFVILAVAKVFLFDMAGLTGLWRAFSFIGLGIVLIGIGLVYQRVLFSGQRPSGEPASVAADKP